MSENKSFAERQFPQKTKNYSDQELIFQLEHISYYKGACEGLKDVLNEKLCDNFLMITNRYVGSAIEKERAKIISPELQELETMLKAYREAFKQHGKLMADMYIKGIVNKIKELYGHK